MRGKKSPLLPIPFFTQSPKTPHVPSPPPESPPSGAENIPNRTLHSTLQKEDCEIHQSNFSRKLLAMNYYHYYSLNSFLCSTPHFSPTKYPFHHHFHLSSTVSCSLRRHHRRRKTPRNPNQPKPSDEKLQIAIDFQSFSNKASSLPIRKLINSSQLRFNEFVQNGNEALEDLMTMITVDTDRRVIISCRPSTVRFVGNLVLFGFVILVALRVLVKVGSGFWGKMGFGNRSGMVVRRRDRSLGGREVVVATTRRHTTRNGEFRVLEKGSGLKPAEEMRKSGIRRMVEEKLPSWWPVSLPPPVLIDEKEQYQRMANRLIRGFVC